MAAPLPTILPSYNQIGFDSLHYLIGLVEGDAPATPSRGSSARKLAEGSNTTVVDPATRVLFPFQVTYDGGALTLARHRLRDRVQPDPPAVRVLPHRDARRRPGARAKAARR